MSLRAQSLVLVMLLVVVLLLMKIEGNSTVKEVHENGTSGSSMVKKDENQFLGCELRPWLCNRGEFPPRFMCCEDRCVDVTSDENNCGLCGITCMFGFKCCYSMCLNINLNIFNCGRCGRVCPMGTFCIFGLCAFEQAMTVSPSPHFPPLPPEKKSSQPLHYQPHDPEMPPAMD